MQRGIHQLEVLMPKVERPQARRLMAEAVVAGEAIFAGNLQAYQCCNSMDVCSVEKWAQLGFCRALRVFWIRKIKEGEQSKSAKKSWPLFCVFYCDFVLLNWINCFRGKLGHPLQSITLQWLTVSVNESLLVRVKIWWAGARGGEGFYLRRHLQVGAWLWTKLYDNDIKCDTSHQRILCCKGICVYIQRERDCSKKTKQVFKRVSERSSHWTIDWTLTVR